MSNLGTVLVTGGAGYIGSHTCKALASSGYIPVSYDNLSYGRAEAVQWGPLEVGDIGDRERLEDVIYQYRPSAVLHFAAFAYVGESVSNPGKYYRNNVAGSLNLIEAARDSNIRSIVFSSTCATYGIPENLPISEDEPQKPINPYGHSKLMVEQMLADFGAAHDLNWAALRYFNAAGADPGNQIGENHDPETHLIPLVLDTASGRRDSITVFGSDYDTPDGTCVRDYIHVSDLAEAHVLALQYLESGSTSGAFNLGNGTGYSVLEVIAVVEKVTGQKVPVVEGGRRPGDPARLICDASRAHELLGWQPRVCDLKEIIATAWAWHQRRPVPNKESAIV